MDGSPAPWGGQQRERQSLEQLSELRTVPRPGRGSVSICRMNE